MKNQTHTYHIGPWRWFFFLSPGGFFVLFFGLLGALGGGPALIITAILVALITLPFVLIALRTRLVLTAEGVEVHQFGYHLKAPWDNIELLDNTKFKEGFVLKSPLEDRGAHRLAGMVNIHVIASGASMPSYQGGRPELVAQRRFIPIEAFAHWLRAGDMKKSVEKFAPQLAFESTPIVQAKVPATTWIWVSTLVVGGIVLGLMLATHSLPAPVELFILRLLNSVQATCCLAFALMGFYSTYDFDRRGRWGWALVALLGGLIALGSALAIAGEEFKKPQIDATDTHPEESDSPQTPDAKSDDAA